MKKTTILMIINTILLGINLTISMLITTSLFFSFYIVFQSNLNDYANFVAEVLKIIFSYAEVNIGLLLCNIGLYIITGFIGEKIDQYILEENIDLLIKGRYSSK